MTLSRVTLITETFAPEVNGVTNTLGHLVKGMGVRDIQVQVIRPRQHKNDNSQQQDNIHSVTLPGLPIPGYSELKFGLPFKRRIRRQMQAFQPQAVYVATEGPMGWAAAKAAKSLNIPVLSGFHTNFHQYIEHYHLGLLEGLAYRYLRHFHNLTAGTLVPTRSQRDELESHGFKNVRVMSRGVDSHLFAPSKRSTALRQQWGASDDDMVVLYVGRIAGEKNMDLALATYLHLRQAEASVKLVLVGDGPELKNIQDKHPDVICCGMQLGEDLATHYASGDVFLFPSKTDTFGNVVTEAMASGLAVVSFDYAAAREHIKHTENGMVAPFGNDQDYIQQATTLLDSPNLLNTIRSKARQTAQYISWDSIVDEFIQRLTTGVRSEESLNGNSKADAKSSATI